VRPWNRKHYRDLRVFHFDSVCIAGRFRHFAWMSNPLNGLVSSSELEKAKLLVMQYKEGREPPGTREEQVSGSVLEGLGATGN